MVEVDIVDSQYSIGFSLVFLSNICEDHRALEVFPRNVGFQQYIILLSCRVKLKRNIVLADAAVYV